MKRRLLSAIATTILFAACNSVTPNPVAQTVLFPGTPNGVAVRDTDGAIFVTDDKTNAIAMTSRIGDEDFAPYARIPSNEGERAGLSQIAFAPNGHLLVERFGFGFASAIFDVAPSGQIALASDTNAQRRRLGLLVLDGGTFLSSWFTKEGSAPATGGVSVITRGTAPRQVIERDIVGGLQKPVGLATAGDMLFIADQAANRIYKVDLQTARAANAPVPASDVVATIDAPDLMTASPDGTLYTKCGAHAVCSVSARGRTAIVANEIAEPRGVAVDVARKRLVIVDRAGALRVVPLK